MEMIILMYIYHYKAKFVSFPINYTINLTLNFGQSAQSCKGWRSRCATRCSTPRTAPRRRAALRGAWWWSRAATTRTWWSTAASRTCSTTAPRPSWRCSTRTRCAPSCSADLTFPRSKNHSIIFIVLPPVLSVRVMNVICVFRQIYFLSVWCCLLICWSSYRLIDPCATMDGKLYLNYSSDSIELSFRKHIQQPMSDIEHFTHHLFS